MTLILLRHGESEWNARNLFAGRVDVAFSAGRTVLVAAHGHSLRALIKHLDRVSDADIVGLNVPTGVPLVYQLNDGCTPTGPARYLDPQAAAEGIAAVAAQGTRTS